MLTATGTGTRILRSFSIRPIPEPKTECLSRGLGLSGNFRTTVIYSILNLLGLSAVEVHATFIDDWRGVEHNPGRASVSVLRSRKKVEPTHVDQQSREARGRVQLNRLARH